MIVHHRKLLMRNRPGINLGCLSAYGAVVVGLAERETSREEQIVERLWLPTAIFQLWRSIPPLDGRRGGRAGTANRACKGDKNSENKAVSGVFMCEIGANDRALDALL